MKAEGEMRGVMGGAILIALGALMILNSSDIYGFDKSWPILLIVISAAMLVRRARDTGGWFIGIVGVGFFVMENFYPQMENWGQYAFPVFLILLGGYIIFKKINRKRSKE